jgi:hypothetical protein
MFEKIVIRRHDTSNDVIDAGRLAEALLFYSNVHLLLDSGGLTGLVKQIGADQLLSLLRDKRITTTFVRDFLGTHTETPFFGPPKHKFIAATLHAYADGRPVRNRHRIQDSFARALGEGRVAKAKAEKFMRYTEFTDYVPANTPPAEDLTRLATRDLDDASYVRSVVETVVRSEAPGYRFPSEWYFGVADSYGEFIVHSNLDFAAINVESRKRRNSKDDIVTVPWLLEHVLDVRGDLHFASEYMAELATDPLRSQLIQIKFDEFMRRHVKSMDDVGSFQTVQLQNALAIREAINSGSRTFSEFMGVLERADRFREWLQRLNPDAQLLNEYYREVTRDSWAQGLPGKVSRFAFFTLGGVVVDTLLPMGGLGTAIGVTISAVDAFWLDRLTKGWRPNQFIDGPLKRFVDK